MHILLVEDEALIRWMEAEELTEEGFVVIEAATADQAASLMADASFVFGLLITDIHTPGRLNGIQLAEILHQTRPAIPVIFTTGRPDVLVGAIKLRPTDRLLHKPYTPTDLLDLIRCMQAETVRSEKHTA